MIFFRAAVAFDVFVAPDYQYVFPDPGSQGATATLVIIGSIITAVSALITALAALLNALTARQAAQRAAAIAKTSTESTLWVPNTVGPKRKRSRWRRF